MTASTMLGAARREASDKLRKLGYRFMNNVTVEQVCELVCQHTGRPYPFDPLPFLIRFVSEGQAVRAASPDWNCMERPEYRMKGAMAIAAQRARESL